MGSMNLGIYIFNLADKDQLMHVSSFINKNLNSENIHDISIFYDNVDFNPHHISCGMFNSTDLWSFNGNLITTSLEALATSLKVVNNINIYYYYGWEKTKNALQLVMLTKNVKIICNSENDAKEVYRLTGNKPIGISNNFNNIIDLLSRCEDEYQSNNNDVYQTA
jgi:hypothetical protein